jgi:glycosyltransferase involved in cell wall biosynthesis
LEAGERITLVAGDNYGALLLCLALRKILRGHIRVQISIHGNPFSSHHHSMKALLRKLSFRILVPYASSIRLVSIHLREELGTYFNKEAEVVICPIPMTLPPLAHSRSRNGTVGVIGRLHDERGTGLLCEIITTFAESQNNLKFIVVGDGPQRSQLESIVLKFRDLNLKLLGSVSHAQVLGSYSNFDLLLSCAPSEGYGLALREAILSGIPVIAKENLGTLELIGSFPDMVFLYRSRTEAFELISSTLGFQPDLEIVENYRKKQIEFDESSILALVKSWS